MGDEEGTSRVRGRWNRGPSRADRRLAMLVKLTLTRRKRLAAQEEAYKHGCFVAGQFRFNQQAAKTRARILGK